MENLTALVIPALSGVAGLTIGLIIGYYKSKAEFTVQLGSLVTGVECSDNRRTIGAELEKGNKDFGEIKDSIGSIRTSMAVLQKVVEGISMDKEGGRG